MGAGNLDPTEEVLGDLPGSRVVVWYKWNVGFDARGNIFRKVTGKKSMEGNVHFTVCVSIIQPSALTEAFQDPCTGSQARWLSAIDNAKPPSSYSACSNVPFTTWR